MTSSSAVTIGSVEPFNNAAESWNEYVERMEMFFLANDIPDAKKKAILLSSVGAKTFRLVKTLLAPTVPSEASFKDIVDIVQAHECPKPSPIVQRYKFNSRSQKQDETIAQFVADLRCIAEHCDFGGSLDDMLRDRLVCGIRDVRMQRRLLSEKDLKFPKAYDIAQAMETAVKQAEDLQMPHQINRDVPINKVTKTKTSTNNKQARQHVTKTQLQGKCFRCGSQYHKSSECKHKQTVCYNCGTQGHLKHVCLKSVNKTAKGYNKPISKGKTHFTKELDACVDDDGTYALFSLSDKSVDPYKISLEIEGVKVSMEIDTGAAVSVMSENEFHHHWKNKLEIKESNTYLKTYTGEKIKVRGVCNVNVESKEGKTNLPLVIVPGKGTSLIGRNWMQHIKLDWCNINKIGPGKCATDLVNKYPDVFSEGLGDVKGVEAKIFLADDAIPKFCKSRAVPFGIKEKVEVELSRLQDLGIITPVDFSDWAAPIVPVVKSDGSIRICGDYKLTINKSAKIDRYPLPLIDDLFAKLGGGKLFSKLDMSHAYQQVQLEEKSREYTTINTHMGLFRYNRLPFGISSAPGIFQRTMDSITKGLKGVIIYMDDVLVSGETQADHDLNLRNLLDRFRETGVKLRKEKCVFNASEVEYLGYKIDAQGLRPLENKIQAIVDAPNPKNVSELKAYLGLLNYYGRFLPSLSTVLAPLYELLSQKVKWQWLDRQEDAFKESKQLLLTSNVLVHYDPGKPLMISCDASPYGVGIVLSHIDGNSENPIAFASRRLSNAEMRYSQLDKEALAIMFGIKKFHKYLYGSHFTILTDHKPLLGILGETKGIPQMASPRMQRWALSLAAYNYVLKHKAGCKHQNADALSRLPVGGAPDDTPMPGDVILLLERVNESPIKAQQIASWTYRDPILSKVFSHVQHGWKDGECNDNDFLPYYRRRNELSVESGLVLWGSRVILPPQGRNAIMGQLHEGHPGISRMKSIARSFVWWPGIDKQLEETVRQCEQCQKNHNNPPAAPLNPWPWPDRAWSRIHIDYAGPFMNKMFLVVIDAHSKWIEAVAMDSSTTQATIAKLRGMFATFGIPEMIVSDNGRSFTSSEFAEFVKRNGIKHVRTAPYHPASNGQAERAVQVVKNGLRKMSSGTIETKLARFLFHYRNTPQTSTGHTPAQLMFGRPVRTHLEAVKPDIGRTVRENQGSQKEHHDVHAKHRSFHVEDPVFVRDVLRGSWLNGVVVDCTGPVSCMVKLSDGRIVKKHYDHIRNRTTKEIADDVFVSDIPSSIVLPTSESVQLPRNTANDVASETVESLPTLPRRSLRIRKPPDRLSM